MKPELINTYPIEVCHLPDGLRVYFPSYGTQKTVKVVEFTSLGKYKDAEVFNLGFGDYNEKSDTVNDRIISNNGDSRKVLNTVLSTIPVFFNYYQGKMLMVRGSDSRLSFKDECNRTCSKKCGEKCRKFNQRIRIYRNYIDLNFFQLNKEY